MLRTRSNYDDQRHCKAETALGSRCAVMRRLVEEFGPCRLAPRRQYFVNLCEAITSQQLAVAAASTIFGRFRGLFPKRLPTPAGVARLDDSELRRVGLSTQKIRYIRSLAEHFATGAIPQRRLARMNDDEVIAALTEVDGIGVWTAQMFLIFVLDRPDVWAVDDLGLRRAVQLQYRRPSLPDKTEMARTAEPWRPYRSVASWYLWRSLHKNGDA